MLQRISVEIPLMLGSLVSFIQFPSTDLKGRLQRDVSIITLKIASYVLLDAVSLCEQTRGHAASLQLE